MIKLATKTVEKKQEPLFTKEQILASNKYADKRDVYGAVLPDDFHGTLTRADSLVEKFMKGKVN